MTDTAPESMAPQANEATDAPAPEAEAPTVAAVPPAEKDWQAEYNTLHDTYLRLAADFENFRKRMNTDREALLKYGAQNTVEMLLPVLDNLELGSSSLSEASDPKMLYQSFTMLSQQLYTALEDAGLKKLTPANQPFDPAIHDAIAQEPSPDVAENTIVRVQKSGYQLHDRVLRPAQVVVAAAPVAPVTAEPAAGYDTAASNPFAGSAES